MNYNINDQKFINSEIYQQFLTDNPKEGYLRIRAYAANQAIPINNLKIRVVKNIGKDTITFFEGYTNDSGIIPRIILPAPILNQDDLIEPKSTSYDIIATYEPDNITKIFKILIYENVRVIQNINIVPSMNMGGF